MNVIERGAVIGIIGGGQLGKMTAEAARKLGYKTHVFCPDEEAPAYLSCDEKTIAFYDDYDALGVFADSVDVVTFEFENIPAKSVAFLENRVVVRPHWYVLELSQNRIKEKNFINSLGIGTAPFKAVYNAVDLAAALEVEGFSKAILKTTELGYDGKGQYVITEPVDAVSLWKEFGADEGVLEGFVPFICEISVIVACNASGEVKAYPPAENVHKKGILDVSFVPATVSVDVALKAQDLAIKIAQSLEMCGLLAIEFFVTEGGELLVNEMAPRPHNSGHWTMDGAVTSQFEQFVRAVCNLPLGDVAMAQATRMLNLIGEDVHQIDGLVSENSVVHLYGKKEAREGRKMGHINMLLGSE